MTTQFITLVYYEGTLRVAQDKSADGDPEAQGVWLRDWLDLLYSTKGKRLLFLDRLKEARFTTARKVAALTPSPVSSWKDIYPQFYLRTGPRVLDMILQSTTRLLLSNNYWFTGCYSCQWVYVLDFDHDTFEIYRGANTSHPVGAGDRFFGLELSLKDRAMHPNFYPPTLLYRVPMSKLPGRDQFLVTVGSLWKTLRYEMFEINHPPPPPVIPEAAKAPSK